VINYIPIKGYNLSFLSFELLNYIALSGVIYSFIYYAISGNKTNPDMFIDYIGTQLAKL
jgi:hypothetical protein